MQSSGPWGVLQKYDKMVDLAHLNAGEQALRSSSVSYGNRDLTPICVDPDNWKWEEKGHWAVASNCWQKFKEKWYGNIDNQQPSSDGHLQSLSLEQLALEYLPFNNSSSSIFVRESYVTMFQLVWARAMSSKGETGVLITGQPGIGAHLFSHLHHYK